MGYRSEILIKTNKKGYDLLKAMSKDPTIPKDERPLAGLNVFKFTTPDGEEIYKLYHDYIKWYPEYKQIQLLYEAFDHMNNLDIPIVFLRIGEDQDDMEEFRSEASYDDDSDVFSDTCITRYIEGPNITEYEVGGDEDA